MYKKVTKIVASWMMAIIMVLSNLNVMAASLPSELDDSLVVTESADGSADQPQESENLDGEIAVDDSNAISDDQTNDEIDASKNEPPTTVSGNDLVPDDIAETESSDDLADSDEPQDPDVITNPDESKTLTNPAVEIKAPDESDISEVQDDATQTEQSADPQPNETQTDTLQFDDSQPEDVQLDDVQPDETQSDALQIDEAQTAEIAPLLSELDTQLDTAEAVSTSTNTYIDPSTVIGEVDPPSTFQEVYERLIAFKSIYPEGLYWDNYTPFGSNGPFSDAYVWKGGAIYGANKGSGCMGFAFILSDGAFGNLPAHPIPRGGFTFDDVRVGDILRVNGNSHSVIVLQKSAGGVIIAEGNFNKTVHWGRAMSADAVMNADFIITRYPSNFIPSDADNADDVVANGTEGNLSWTLTHSGTLTVAGSGAMSDFSPTGQLPSWSAHNDAISTIVIEAGVTSIGNYAFSNCQALSVYIPSSVTKIGQGAFSQTALLSVTVPASVQSIGDEAFSMCQNLTSATISEGIKTIGTEAFRGCIALTHIDFPSSVSSVGYGAFMSCEEMTSVRFVPSTTQVVLGDNLFSQCWHLSSVTLPQSLDRISAGMFQSCSALPELYIPASVVEIGENPFTSCRFLATIKFGGSENAWNAIASPYLKASLQSTGTSVVFDVKFDDPFAKDPNDPGDFHPVDPDNPDNPPVDPKPTEHQHDWSNDWSHDDATHWHECLTADCSVSSNNLKEGYSEHTFSDWIIDKDATTSQDGNRHRDCTICTYQQADVIPATGDSSNPPTDNPGGSDQNPDGPNQTPGNTPDDSGNTDTPSNPNNPGDSGDHTPDDPEKPSIPNQPSDKPGSSGGESSQPGNSGGSNGSDDSNNSGKPNSGSQTQQPSKPTQPSGDHDQSNGSGNSGSSNRPGSSSSGNSNSGSSHKTDNSSHSNSNSSAFSTSTEKPIDAVDTPVATAPVTRASTIVTPRSSTASNSETTEATSDVGTTDSELSTEHSDTDTGAGASVDEDGYLNDIPSEATTEADSTDNSDLDNTTSASSQTVPPVAFILVPVGALGAAGAFVGRASLAKLLATLLKKFTGKGN